MLPILKIHHELTFRRLIIKVEIIQQACVAISAILSQDLEAPVELVPAGLNGFA